MQALRMGRGIIFGLLTLAVMLLITFGLDAFLDGVPEPWHTLRWALFMGGLFFLTNDGETRLFARFAASGGLCGIVGSAVAFDQSTPFPGLNAFIPCGGAALFASY
jgi:peptidoglycan/LPS O-acetylase OafA/YrhL